MGGGSTGRWNDGLSGGTQIDGLWMLQCLKADGAAERCMHHPPCDSRAWSAFHRGGKKAGSKASTYILLVGEVARRFGKRWLKVMALHDCSEGGCGVTVSGGRW